MSQVQKMSQLQTTRCLNYKTYLSNKMCLKYRRCLNYKTYVSITKHKVSQLQNICLNYKTQRVLITKHNMSQLQNAMCLNYKT
jgi:hypothetical protein